jgi:hypothetical protein
VISVTGDAEPPTTTDDAPEGCLLRVVTVHFDAWDTGSGVAETRYRVDGGLWITGTSVPLSRAIRHKLPGYTWGDHLIEYYSTDNAGNVEIMRSCTVTLGS